MLFSKRKNPERYFRGGEGLLNFFKSNQFHMLCAKVHVNNNFDKKISNVFLSFVDEIKK